LLLLDELATDPTSTLNTAINRLQHKDNGETALDHYITGDAETAVLSNDRHRGSVTPIIFREGRIQDMVCLFVI